MRFLPHTDADRRAMLDKVGVGSIDDLFADIPADKRIAGLLELPTTRSEIEVERVLGRLAARNVPAGSVPFFVGAGAYRHYVPASVDHLIQRSEFLTSYTPYQPEVSQGTLQYLFEFQTQVANLTAMEVANASMYDGSTATAEAVLMAQRLTKRRKAVLSGGLHPQYRSVVETVSRMAEDTLVALPSDPTRQRGAPRGDRQRHLLRRRPVAILLRPPRRPPADRRESPFGRRAARRGVHRSGRARRDRAAGGARRRHRRRRGPVDRQSADLRRPLCRPLRHAPEIRPPDARPAVRRDGRRRRPPRLRADALHPRATHPPRQGDLQYLHQFGPVRARLHHPHDAARRDRPRPPRRAQPRQRGEARRGARRGARRQRAQRDLLQRIHHPRPRRLRRW